MYERLMLCYTVWAVVLQSAINQCLQPYSASLHL